MGSIDDRENKPSSASLRIEEDKKPDESPEIVLLSNDRSEAASAKLLMETKYDWNKFSNFSINLNERESLKKLKVNEDFSEQPLPSTSNNSYDTSSPSTSAGFRSYDKDDSFITVSSLKNSEEIQVGEFFKETVAIQSDLTVGVNEIIVADRAGHQPPPPYYDNRSGLGGGRTQPPAYVTTTPVYYQTPQNVSQSPTHQVNQQQWRQQGSSDSDYYFMAMMDFEITKIRHRFIQRVYAILFFQLLISFGFIFLCKGSKKVENFVQTNQGLYMLALVLNITLYCILICYKTVRRHFPLNFIILAFFTLTMAYIMGVISTIYATQVVLISAGTTAFLCLLVSIFAMQTKFDVTECGFILCILTLGVIVYGLIAAIVSLFYPTPYAHLIYTCLATILFMMYLMYDTQQIIGGRRIELSPEEYIYGALTLYTDIAHMFLLILQIIGSGQR